MLNNPPKKILVVDDEQIILDYLKRILRDSYEVITTAKGEDALVLVKDLKPDLVILDIRLPDMRGEQVKRMIAKDEAINKIPVILLTGLITKEDAGVINRLAQDYPVLAKPVTKRELLEAIDQVLPA